MSDEDASELIALVRSSVGRCDRGAQMPLQDVFPVQASPLWGSELQPHTNRERVVAKVDEVVMNYICLLKAAEAATVGAPGEHSVKALVRHSSTMSAIANALTRSLKTLLSK
ncbi:hypothetical protein KUCAC02_000968 [Chaenocephalus aceratus]|uniref:Uncharacterized protein n=1 Tax=Chaenocephalus aceratus TaxID=36190 RepID=A0ACB9XW96_CHAAC|nr:hypothetical protein KUCAC02_000968 [Chaenocephalus aceratus]